MNDPYAGSLGEFDEPEPRCEDCGKLDRDCDCWITERIGEAVAIADGKTMMLPTREHVGALVRKLRLESPEFNDLYPWRGADEPDCTVPPEPPQEAEEKEPF